MRINWFILLLILTSCFSSEENPEEIKSFDSNVDSLFLSADATVKEILNNREKKVLLEQDLWRKKRDIKNIKKIYSDSIWNLSNMYERNILKMGEDSVVYNYKIVLREIIDTVRVTVTDTVCGVCLTKQNKKDNRWYKKTFRWIKKTI
jgi:hypothetical protein|tara:strand:- start:1009 stop:1452 length:444 start_codon:yes stop_codon:yes gene_type:complete